MARKTIEERGLNMKEYLIYNKNGIRAVMTVSDTNEKHLMLFVEDGAQVMDKADTFEFCHTLEDRMRRFDKSAGNS